MKLKNKVAIITGAARGLGKSMANVFAAQGASLVLVDVSTTSLEQTAKELADLYQTPCLTLAVDVSKTAQVDDMVQKTIEKFSRVDILINNAGILRDATLVKMSDEQFDQVIDVNLKAVFLCGRACARVMVAQKYGKIVNISSVAARGNFGQTNYSATKAGVVGMTKTWALELSKANINTNAIAPGLIATEMTQSIPEEVRQMMINHIPLKRMGLPEEVAQLACFLASDEASYIQGEVININGGFLM